MNVCMNMQENCIMLLSATKVDLPHIERQIQEMNYEYQKCSRYLWSPLGNSHFSPSTVIAENRFFFPHMNNLCSQSHFHELENKTNWFSKNDSVKFCIKTGKLVRPTSASGLLEKRFFVFGGAVWCTVLVIFKPASLPPWVWPWA